MIYNNQPIKLKISPITKFETTLLIQHNHIFHVYQTNPEICLSGERINASSYMRKKKIWMAGIPHWYTSQWGSWILIKESTYQFSYSLFHQSLIDPTHNEEAANTSQGANLSILHTRFPLISRGEYNNLSSKCACIITVSQHQQHFFNLTGREPSDSHMITDRAILLIIFSYYRQKKS